MEHGRGIYLFLAELPYVQERKLGLDHVCYTSIQFEFQLYTLNPENSDQTKSQGGDCDRANLD